MIHSAVPTDRFPAIRLLIKAYFDEDWSEESGGDPDAAVLSFVHDEPDLVLQLEDEIDGVVAQGDEFASTVVRRLGPYYDLAADGHTDESWLRHVVEVLHTASKPTS